MGDMDPWYNSSYTVQYYTSGSSTTTDNTTNTYIMQPQQFAAVPEVTFQPQVAAKTFGRKNKFHNADLAWLEDRVEDVLAVSGIAA